MRKLASTIREISTHHARMFAMLAVLAALTLGLTSAAKGVFAAPSQIIGPDEATSGRVVALNPGNTFQLERPMLTNPAAGLEQVTVQPPVGATVNVCDDVSLVGNYDTDSKVFIAKTLTFIDNSCKRAGAAAGSSGGDNDNGGGDSNDNGGGDNNDGGGDNNDGDNNDGGGDNSDGDNN